MSEIFPIGSIPGDPGFDRCARCHHPCDAHEPESNGACAVNAHESATGPECECEAYINPATRDWGVVYAIDGTVYAMLPGVYVDCKGQYDALRAGWSEVYLVRIVEGGDRA